MKVVFCSSEIFPYAKTGGLADVSGALPFALAAQGVKVKVFMPWYKGISPDKTYPEYGYSKKDKVEIYFVKSDKYFNRDALYGTPTGDYPDNLERFSFLCKKIFALLKEQEFYPDIFHCNDWQTALIPVYLKTLYANTDFSESKSVLTIHNLAYQGVFPKESYPVLNIDWQYFNMHQLEFYDQVNLLKGGIVFADFVNTVSPTYAKQITTKEYGCGLEGVLSEKKDRLEGILNAISYDVWSPEVDNSIYKKYSVKTIKNKYINKLKLQEDLGLKVDKDMFVLGMVTRLAQQKGVDILCQALPKFISNAQLIILGFGDEKYHAILKDFAAKHKAQFSLNLKFDEKIAHSIYAASDAFLMPSRFEPCGLSQMMSYKYGTVPIVHNTGGLTDTVTDYNQGGGGFVLTEYSASALNEAIARATQVFKDKGKWENLVAKIMQYNFSWDVAAKNYIKMYKNI